MTDLTCTAFFAVAEKINGTNNGKLMLKNLTPEERTDVPYWIELGLVERDTFIAHNDSIRLTD